MVRRRCDFIEERDKEIMRRYAEIVRDRNCRTQKEALTYVVKSASTRFWVSPECLEKVIRYIKNGGDISNMSQTKQAMYNELYHRYIKYRKESKYAKMRLRHLCEILVEEIAPEFYLLPETAMDIFNNMKKRRRRMITK